MIFSGLAYGYSRIFFNGSAERSFSAAPVANSVAAEGSTSNACGFSRLQVRIVLNGLLFNAGF